MENPKIKIAVPADLLERLRIQADKETRPISNLIVAILKNALPEREKACQ